MSALQELISAHRIIGAREEWYPGGIDVKLCRCGREIPVSDGIEAWEAHLAEVIPDGFADARIARALALIDVWLHDESVHDNQYQRWTWEHVREIRAALTGEEQ